MLFGVSLDVKAGEIVVLVGSNGAGKTTLLNSIMGLTHIRSGRIIYQNQDLTGKRPHEISRSGIALVPQEDNVFSPLTVSENLQMAGYLITDPGEYEQKLAFIYEIFPILQARGNQRARTLSGGERQMLAIGMALLQSPRLLLLDEPSTGLSPIILKQVMDIIKEINRQLGTSILIVEQRIKEAFAVADKAYVLKNGRIVLSSDNPAALDREELRQSYLT